MLVSNLSNDNQPCWLLQADNVTILLDCPLNYYPLHQARFIGKVDLPRFQVPDLKKIIDLQSIDAILISNYHTFTALPWITETGQEWNGTIYCTKPTMAFAQIYLTQLRKFCDEEEHAVKAEKLKSNGKIYGEPNSYKMVSQSQIESCLERVQIINFGETLSIFGAASIKPHSSGYSIGSCIWIIEINRKKIVYLNDYTNLRTHCAKADVNLFKNADLMILSGLKASDMYSPDSSVHEVERIIINTLKNNENVMFPVFPSGLIFDLIEILADQLKRNRLGTVPFYYVAPMSKDSLAHAQIYPEFLSVEKQNKAAAPEFPFTHDEAIENGRLKIFEHATEGLSEHFKGPAVIFTGHPSLELGQAKEWSQKWHESKRNKVIIAEPNFHQSVYRDRRGTVIYLPIDTRMTQGSAKLQMEDWKPKELIISHKMSQQYQKLNEISSSQMIKVTSIAAYKTYSCNIDKNASVLVTIQPSLAKDIRMQRILTNHGQQIQLAQFSGVLKVKNHKYELAAVEREPSQQLIGQMKSKELLIQNLEELGFQDIEIGKDELIIPGGKIKYSLTETLIHHSDKNIRSKLITAVRNSLLF